VSRVAKPANDGSREQLTRKGSERIKSYLGQIFFIHIPPTSRSVEEEEVAEEKSEREISSEKKASKFKIIKPSVCVHLLVNFVQRVKKKNELIRNPGTSETIFIEELKTGCKCPTF
jgi:hypothetical protein